MDKKLGSDDSGYTHDYVDEELETNEIPQYLDKLRAYSPCEISDGLRNLGLSGGGFLRDIHPIAPFPANSSELATQEKVVGQAYTVEFGSRTLVDLFKKSNIPKEKHYVDDIKPGSIVVLSQEADQTCAVLGGIMATRMKHLGVVGVVISGRVRDVRELQSLGLPIWAKGTSIISTNAQAKAIFAGTTVTVEGLDYHGTLIKTGDVILCDPLDGIVTIPLKFLRRITEYLPRFRRQEDAVTEAVKSGMTVKEAFERFREPLD